jgi:hypothetical protein
VVAGRGQESCRRCRKAAGGDKRASGAEGVAGGPEKDRRWGAEHRLGGRSGLGARKGQMGSAMLADAAAMGSAMPESD